MPLVAMETMTSSVLREANNSLLASHHVTAQSVAGEQRYPVHTQSQNEGRNGPGGEALSSERVASYDHVFPASYNSPYDQGRHKQEVVDFSFPACRGGGLADGRLRSSPAEQVPNLKHPLVSSRALADTPTSAFSSLLNPGAHLLTSQSAARMSPAEDVPLNVGAPGARHMSSLPGSPLSHTRQPPNSGHPTDEHHHSLSSHLGVDQSGLEKYKADSANFDIFDAYVYLSEEGRTPELSLDTEHYLEEAYPQSDPPRLERGHFQPGTGSASNSMDNYDIANDGSSKCGDSDYSNTSNDHFLPGQPATTIHNFNNNFDSINCSLRQSISTPVSISTPIPSPSSLSQAASDTTLSEVRYKLPDDDDFDSGAQGKSSKSRGKPRGAQNLPPCRVCGNVASGLHFGVNTCEACNEFFRRSLKRGAAYYCSKNRECQVYGKKRNACSFCRYHRCVQLGMSRDAIKTGRYSHKTRTEYAMEVEKFKQIEVSRVETEKYEVLLSDLVKYHDKYIKVTTRVPEENLLKNQRDYLEIFLTQREHENRHPPLKATIENKRLQEGWTMAKEDLSLTMHDVEMTELWLRNYINFAKNVPGFKQLALSDQASLVRGSWFEFWFLGAYRGYNSSLQVVVYPNGRCFHRDEIRKVFGTEYTDFSFYLADRMRSLQVSPEVMVLVKAVCLTFPDRASLANKEAVDKMHWLMVSCLMHTLEKHKTGDSAVFPMVVSKLVELRTLTDIAMRAHKNALYQDVLKDSPLLCEMVDTKTSYVQSTTNKDSVSVTASS